MPTKKKKPAPGGALSIKEAFREVLNILEDTKTTRKDSVNFNVLRKRYEEGKVSDKKMRKLLEEHGYTLVAEERWTK